MKKSGSYSLNTKKVNFSSAKIKKLIPSFTISGIPEKRVKEQIKDKYKNLHIQPSMLLKNNEELNKVANNVQDMLYANYFLGEKYLDKFPKNCCGVSSMNLFYSLIYKGYANAIYSANHIKDHDYISLPFVIGKSNEKGIMLADSTAFQLWKKLEHKPTVMLSVYFKPRWKYETNWANKADLYPNLLYGLQEFLGNKEPKMSISIYKTKEYYKECFNNPIRLDIKP